MSFIGFMSNPTGRPFGTGRDALAQRGTPWLLTRRYVPGLRDRTLSIGGRHMENLGRPDVRKADELTLAFRRSGEAEKHGLPLKGTGLAAFVHGGQP